MLCSVFDHAFVMIWSRDDHDMVTSYHVMVTPWSHLSRAKVIFYPRSGHAQITPWSLCGNVLVMQKETKSRPGHNQVML
ncbi:hypothetical protein RRG08_056446 [Elysia crispata]|uniref:Uncharacterized protein n=1 Tax=Elysia crispata TaxID=231223 RepID=A0AAE1DE27_9GAST|nr:hypothetical protein RRG08_056446 [Elysia crispata]